MNLVCSVSNCNRFADWRPRITCLPEAAENSDELEPAEIHINLGFCHEHLHFATEENMLPDSAWDVILQSFKESGEPLPDRKSVKFNIEPVREAVVFH